MERVPERPLLPVSSWIGSIWGLRAANGDVIGAVQAVDGDIVSLAIVGTESDSTKGVVSDPPTETRGRVVCVSTKSLLVHWEHVDRGRAGFWRRYRPVR